MTKLMKWLCLPALLAAAPAGAQVVTGSVVNDRGGPLANATVMVSARNGKVVAATSADDNGQYTLQLPAAGYYRLHVMGEEHVPKVTPFRVAEGATYASNVRLRAHYAEREVEQALQRSGLERPVGMDGRPVGRTTAGGSPGGRPAPTGKAN